MDKDCSKNQQRNRTLNQKGNIFFYFFFHNFLLNHQEHYARTGTGRGVAVYSSPNSCHRYTDIIGIISSWKITGVKGKKLHGKSPDPQSVVFIRGEDIESHSQLLTKVNIYGTENHFKCTLFMQRLVMSTSCLNRERIYWDNFNKKAHRKQDISPRKWSVCLSLTPAPIESVNIFHHYNS